MRFRPMRLVLSGLALCLVGLYSGQAAARSPLAWPTATFSAQMVIQNGEPRGPRTVTARVFNAGPKVRLDITQKGRKFSLVFDRQAKTRWVFAHDQRTAVKLPYDAKRDFAVRFNLATGALVREAGETVNGVATVRYKFTGRNADGEPFAGHIWRAPNGIIVRLLESQRRPGKARRYAMDLKDIRYEKLPPSTFAPPAGYKVIDRTARR